MHKDRATGMNIIEMAENSHRGGPADLRSRNENKENKKMVKTYSSVLEKDLKK